MQGTARRVLPGLLLLGSCAASGTAARPVRAGVAPASVAELTSEAVASPAQPAAGLGLPERSEPSRRELRPLTSALGPLGPDDGSDEDGSDSPWERFSFSAGGLLAALDSDGRFGPAGLGVSVSLEDLLGFDVATYSARLEGAWRFTKNRRHRLSLSWVDLGRNARKTLGQDLDLGGGVILPAGSSISSKFSINLIKGDYSYSFFQDDRFDLAGTLGLYVAPVDFELKATGLANFSDRLVFTAPLPVGGVRMDFAITPKWYLRSNLDIFYIEVDGFTGSLADFIGAVEWRPWEHVSFGAGVESFNLGIERNDTTSVPGLNIIGAVDFRYTGLLLYLKGLW